MTRRGRHAMPSRRLAARRGRRGRRSRLPVVGFLSAGVVAVGALVVSAQDPCEFWVAPPPIGSDVNSGEQASPWASLEHASRTVPDGGCTVWLADGVYSGPNQVERRFTDQTTFRAVTPYSAVLEHSSTVLDVDGARNVVFEGFEFRHSGPGATGFVVIVDRSGDLWSEQIAFHNNIFHDSYDNDLLKIHNGVRFATVEGNVFYNQGPNEQHMDVNSVTDVVIQDNVFFNDFARSGRTNANDTKHYIVVKDSNEGTDGLLGSERITIRRNVFLNWEGGPEAFVKIGNDGKPFHEATDVAVESNLMIGNAPNEIDAAFGIDGAADVIFANNTVVGDLPAGGYAYDVGIKGFNPPNENIRFVNNIWSDPTGTMGAGLSGGSNDFSDGEPAETVGFLLDNNLYWNGGTAIPSGDPVNPVGGDPRATIADPLLNPDQQALVVPYWTGSAFLSGNASIRSEFVRLVENYGQIPSNSSAVGGADPAFAPSYDILGNARNGAPDLGAYESLGTPNQPPVANDVDVSGVEDQVVMWWPVVSDPDGHPLTCQIVGPPIEGVATVAADCTTGSYSPAPDANGIFTFTYRAGDGVVYSNTATVTVAVTPVDDPPVASDDNGSTMVETSVFLQATDNDTDADGDLNPTTLSVTSGPFNGTVVNNGDGSITYTPNVAFLGSDSFEYEVCDLAGLCDSATVTIDVRMPFVESFAVTETTVLGSVVDGDLLSTRASDAVYEELREEQSGGRPTRRQSALEHRWTFEVSPGDQVNLRVEAFHSPNTEGDHFAFEYSTDGGNNFEAFATPVVVTATDALGGGLVGGFPTGTGGPVVVRVTDTDRAPGNGNRDVLYVDYLAILTTNPAAALPQVTVEATDPSAAEATPPDPASLVVSRNDPNGTLTVFYTVGGTATAGTDYEALTGSVSFAAGETQAVITVVPRDDASPEPAETVVVTLADGTDYTVGAPSSASVAIADDDFVGADHSAVTETTSHGTVVAGTLVETFLADDEYEVITEQVYAGGKRSRLEHEWTFSVTGGNILTFFVEAHHDGDEDFIFEYSPDGSSWIWLLTVGTTFDVPMRQVLPNDVSGTVYVRVLDSNRSRGDGTAANLFIDHLLIRSEP